MPASNKLTPVNASGTITSGGNAQNFLAANTSRKGWMLQNQSAETMYVRDDGTPATADNNAVKVEAGDSVANSHDYVSGKAVSVIAATTGSAFFAEEVG